MNAVKHNIPSKEPDNLRFFNDVWLVQEMGLSWGEVAGTLSLKDYIRFLVMRSNQNQGLQNASLPRQKPGTRRTII